MFALLRAAQEHSEMESNRAAKIIFTSAPSR